MGIATATVGVRARRRAEEYYPEANTARGQHEKERKEEETSEKSFTCISSEEVPITTPSMTQKINPTQPSSVWYHKEMRFFPCVG